MPRTIDPWGSELIEDYEKLIKDFKLEPFNEGVLKKLPKPNRLMRRYIVFASIGLKRIIEAIKNKEKFYVLSGIMPSHDRIHLGTKMVVENIKYFQEQGADTYLLIADLESLATRNIPLEEAKKRALNFYIPAYIALGLDPKKTTFYFQSENEKVKNLAYVASKRLTLNEFRSAYGAIDPGRIMSALTQIGDILYPQLNHKMPGIIPVGTDQIPHIFLSRDVAKRIKQYNFELPSGIYHKYTPSLDGSIKMSKSKPHSCIELPENIENVKKKIRKALTGGRETLEKQRKLGAIIEQDMVFELLKQHLVENDNELNRIYEDYKSGKMTSSEIKEIACEKMEKFMDNFNKNLEKARKDIGSLKFV